MAKLSHRQQQILDYVQAYHDEHSYMPAVREIQTACDISSTSVVDYNLRILEREGYLRRAPDISRGLELIGASTPVAVPGPEIIEVPLVGSIAAGSPIPVPEAETWRQPDETVGLPPEMTPRRPEELFALRVRGYSMIDALIDDGDVVVLRHTHEARDGDLVAAWLREEETATLKRFYRQGEMVRLQPANATMEPIMVPAAGVEVHGRVVAVLRNLEA